MGCIGAHPADSEDKLYYKHKNIKAELLNMKHNQIASAWPKSIPSSDENKLASS